MYTLQCGTEVRSAVVSGKYRYETKTVSDYPAVGDYVLAAWPEDESSAVITALYPRRSCFIRKTAGSGRQEQVVAANVDTVLICMSLNKNFNLRRLERYLSAAHDSGDGIDTAFSDLDAWSRGCRYTDCTHTSEPGCAVRAALAAGTLAPARWEAYQKLKAENAYAADNSRYMEEKRRKFKKIAKSNRSGRKG